MRIRYLYTILLLLLISVCRAHGQADEDPPVSPVLNLVSVDLATGNVEISWSLSPSPDVSGYVVYLYKDNEGYELDTLYNPAATSYLRTGSGSVYYSESFVVAALDTAGNISPLSNELSTIYTTASIDTCNKSIEVKWNSYSSFPKQVLSYSLSYSVDGGSFTEAGQAAPEKTNFVIDDFIVNAQYCFIVKAVFSGGFYSGSNKACLQIKMQRPPDWINADYATIRDDKSVEVSFTMDPGSERKTIDIERKKGDSGTFDWIARVAGLQSPLIYIDNDADINQVNYYSASFVNNCGIHAVYSNIASNIVLSIQRMEDEILLKWNPYKKWLGEIDRYKLFINTGDSYEERLTLPPGDTSCIVKYSDIMYDVKGKEVCFMIKASETSNPYGISGLSQSQDVCTPSTELITVPTIFTPDNNSVNDLFKPVLSFMPRSYKLVITDLKRKTVFETLDFAEEWDGTKNGNPLPEGVYLWFLNVRTPSGDNMIRSGTVTIMHNR
jgi:gliding motility-associated-like protein